MGFLSFLSEVGDLMNDCAKGKSLEELCNAINRNSISDSFMLVSNSMELSERLREMSNDELTENFEEYSKYRVKNAAKCFITVISERISTMRNIELMTLYTNCSGVEDDAFIELADKAQKELKRRGYI